MANDLRRPGGKLSTRPLHFFWLADCSGSMSDEGKMQSLNYAIRNSIPDMKKVAEENPNAELLVRALKFSNGASWHVADPTPIEEFTWTDLVPAGVTDLGKAFELLASQLEMPPMEQRALPPVIVLVSDGMPTDDYKRGLDKLLSLQWGKKAVKIAIAVGENVDYDVMAKFVNNSEIPVLTAKNAEQLTNYIKWVSTAVVKSSSSPASQVSSDNSANIPIPNIPEVAVDSDDVW